MDIQGIVLSMRPRQWSKNLAVFPALVFARQITHVTPVIEAIEAFAAFCLLSSSIYIANDLLDLERDRAHPIKRKRPLASRRIKPSVGIVVSVILGAISLIIAARLGHSFLCIAASYVALQLSYSLKLKHIVILDVFSISAGFVLRVVGGAEAINVPISSWLLICTMLLALFLALSKRRHELTSLSGGATVHRKTLGEYSTGLLDQMISIVASATVVTYALYTMSAETVARFGTTRLIYTVPFVLYGVFRYLYLVHQKDKGGTPDAVLLTDVPTILCIVLYGISVGLILYVFR